MNSQAFENLPALVYVYLNLNYCINEFFIRKSNNTAFERISKSCGFDEFDAIEVPCEKYEDNVISLLHYQICSMKNQTVINATNFIIADPKDEEIAQISFYANNKIEYLPYKIYLQFPSLFDIIATRCAIKQILKENFEKLNRLEAIHLSYNQIQKISKDTFFELPYLQKIYLGEDFNKSR